jgi:hypothetical protein
LAANDGCGTLHLDQREIKDEWTSRFSIKHKTDLKPVWLVQMLDWLISFLIWFFISDSSFVEQHFHRIINPLSADLQSGEKTATCDQTVWCNFYKVEIMVILFYYSIWVIWHF